MPDEAGGALIQLVGALYADLRRLARRHIDRAAPGQTLQATALLHEAWIKLVGSAAQSVRDRAHFAALVSRVMRQILVDHARARQAERRGGGGRSISVSVEDLADRSPVAGVDVLVLDEVLHELVELSPTKARLVEYRFFAGMTESEAAEALGMSRAEATRQWRLTRAWLAQRLRAEPG